jgi:hypothetical protein
MDIASIGTVLAAVAFPAGGVLGLLRNVVDVWLNHSKSTQSQEVNPPDALTMLNADTTNKLASSLVGRRPDSSLSDTNSSDTLFAPMRWIRFGFAVVAIFLFLVLCLIYAVTYDYSSVLPNQEKVLIMTLLGNIAGYYFTTRHFGAQPSL